VPLRLAEPVERIVEDLHQQVCRMLADARVPVLSIALIQDRECVWSGGFGVTNMHTLVAMSASTVFEAYSLSKPLIACRALQLCDTGALDLDVPLCQYLAEPSSRSSEPGFDDITLRMALSHMSGLSDDEADTSIRFPPGTQWSYSTVGYDLIQQVLARATGTPLATDMLDNLLGPLNMSSSSFVWQDRFTDRMAQGHLADGSPQIDRQIDVDDADSLLTTASDYATFTARLLSGDATLGLSTARLAEMFSDNVRIGARKTGDTPFWGLGWGLQKTPDGESIWDFGGGDGSPVQNLVVAYREQGCGLVALTNGINGQRLFADLQTLELGATPIPLRCGTEIPEACHRGSGVCETRLSAGTRCRRRRSGGPPPPRSPPSHLPARRMPAPGRCERTHHRTRRRPRTHWCGSSGPRC
jgi:CubicO group peptidase (beta-lactamase class C family)